MSIKRQDIEIKVREWTSFADEDLRVARQALKLSSSCPYRIVAYHAQQCAEKYLKAFLVYKKKDFPYTHNIARLLELCQHHGSWPNDLLVAAELTSYAVTARYPGEDTVSRTEALKAVESASLARKTVRSALKQEGLIL
ncbi:MAG: HEPN domain-containing protein [Deltaproteobacteria bacterium]|nr:HEPN domain-containing protein [Deltaproteobacteria bacterium]